MEADSGPNPFWDYSVDIYRKPGVSAACLEVQDRHDLDVNLLLFCFWLGQSRRTVFSVEQFKGLITITADWRLSVVLPIRAARRCLKSWPDPVGTEDGKDLYRAAIALELQTEHAQQQMMFRHALTCLKSQPSQPENDAVKASLANLWVYFEIASILPCDADIPALTKIFAAVFGSSSDARSFVKAFQRKKIRRSDS